MAPNNFRCYFCNKEIVDETPEGHVAGCGSVLEPCPRKCGVYVPRNVFRKHAKVCENRKSLTDADYDYKTGQNVLLRKQADPNNIYETLRRPGESASDKIGSLQRSVHELSAKLNSLAAGHAECSRQHLHASTRLETLSFQGKKLQDFLHDSQAQLEKVRKELKTLDKLKYQNEITIHNVQETIKEIQNFALKLNSLSGNFNEERIFVRENLNAVQNGLQEVKDSALQENAMISAVWADQKKELSEMREQQERLEKDLGEVKERIGNLVFDIRAASELSAESLEVMERQKKDMEEMKNKVCQVKLDVELAEDSLSNIHGLVSTTPGRIIWKITDVKMKLENAKKNEKVPLKGPIFYSKDYGYRIRLLVYLNGLKKWKGRHLLACLQVMKGEYDSILKWPCKIEANVVLKDCLKSENSKDYARYITARREDTEDEAEEPQESSTQYIFIPHSVLNKPEHLRDDTIFIEIKVQERQRTETQM